MLGRGSDTNRDGRFSSIARFESPFGGAFNINLDILTNYRATGTLFFYLNTFEFPGAIFLSFFGKAPIPPTHDGRTQTAHGRALSWIESTDDDIESDYESL